MADDHHLALSKSARVVRSRARRLEAGWVRKEFVIPDCEAACADLAAAVDEIRRKYGPQPPPLPDNIARALATLDGSLSFPAGFVTEARRRFGMCVLRSAGQTFDEIAGQYGVSKQWVHLIIKSCGDIAGAILLAAEVLRDRTPIADTALPSDVAERLDADGLRTVADACMAFIAGRICPPEFGAGDSDAVQGLFPPCPSQANWLRWFKKLRNSTSPLDD